MRTTMSLVHKVNEVTLDQLVGSAPLGRHKALMIDEELANPGANCNHVDKDEDESDPLRPGV